MRDLRPKYQNIAARQWNDVRDAWLDRVPAFNGIGARPDPGLERLVPLQQIVLPENKARFPDVDGVRRNVLWEAVFLFHKCAHAHLASQRLAYRGMHSWCMFNAYHAAYIGARGIMALLGVGLPNLSNGGQLLIDVCPPAETSKKRKKFALGLGTYEEMLIVRMPRIDQQGLWQGFQRVLQMSTVECWDLRIRQELLALKLDSITKRRNAFLYRAAFWPGGDLVADGVDEDVERLLGNDLDSESKGFLLKLSFGVYRLFEQLVNDLADHSGPIRQQIDGSRIMSNPEVAELVYYNSFLQQTQSPEAS